MPRPVSVPRSALPEMLVLGSERYGQWGVDANTLDYERFGSKIWQDDGAGTSVELNAQKDFADFFRSRADQNWIRLKKRNFINFILKINRHSLVRLYTVNLFLIK